LPVYVSCSDGKVTTEVRTFKTTTAGLLQLSAWLAANNCTHVAMEATGVYLYELSQPFYVGVFYFYPPDNLSKGHHAGVEAFREVRFPSFLA
jgi:hypothetical protein